MSLQSRAISRWIYLHISSHPIMKTKLNDYHGSNLVSHCSKQRETKKSPTCGRSCASAVIIFWSRTEDNLVFLTKVHSDSLCSSKTTVLQTRPIHTNQFACGDRGSIPCSRRQTLWPAVISLQLIPTDVSRDTEFSKCQGQLLPSQSKASGHPLPLHSNLFNSPK